jgi:hypothetical protein
MILLLDARVNAPPKKTIWGGILEKSYLFKDFFNRKWG